MDINVKGVIVSSSEKWIYDWFEIEAVCPKEIENAIKNANGEKLDIFINSGGGNVFAGVEIYSLLEAYQGEVKQHVQGLCASAASVILCASESEISSASSVMIHNVQGRFTGDYNAMDKASELLKLQNEAICAAYIKKTGKTKEELLALMDDESWFTAEKAVEFGFCDKISENKNSNNTENSLKNMQMVASFGNIIPQEIINKMQNERFENNKQEKLKKAQAQLNLLNLKGE